MDSASSLLPITLAAIVASILYSLYKLVFHLFFQLSTVNSLSVFFLFNTFHHRILGMEPRRSTTFPTKESQVRSRSHLLVTCGVYGERQRTLITIVFPCSSEIILIHFVNLIFLIKLINFNFQTFNIFHTIIQFILMLLLL